MGVVGIEGWWCVCRVVCRAAARARALAAGGRKGRRCAAPMKNLFEDAPDFQPGPVRGGPRDTPDLRFGGKVSFGVWGAVLGDY